MYLQRLFKYISCGGTTISSDLFKLVHAEDSSGVPTMRPYLLAEARGVSNVTFRKLLWFHPLLPGGERAENDAMVHTHTLPALHLDTGSFY